MQNQILKKASKKFKDRAVLHFTAAVFSASAVAATVTAAVADKIPANATNEAFVGSAILAGGLLTAFHVVKGAMAVQDHNFTSMVEASPITNFKASAYTA